MTAVFKETSINEGPWELLLLADPSREQIEKYIHRSRIFTLDINGSAIGVVVLVPLGNNIQEITNVAVLEPFRGQGFGKRLIAEALQQARAAGARKVKIGTGNSSLNQLALYQKLGFRIEGVDRDYFTRHYPNQIVENGIICRDMIRLSQDL